jgi:hypothetical protein
MVEVKCRSILEGDIYTCVGGGVYSEEMRHVHRETEGEIEREVTDTHPPTPTYVATITIYCTITLLLYRTYIYTHIIHINTHPNPIPPMLILLLSFYSSFASHPSHLAYPDTTPPSRPTQPSTPGPSRAFSLSSLVASPTIPTRSQSPPTAISSVALLLCVSALSVQKGRQGCTTRPYLWR